MRIWELLLLAAGLAMDAFAVSLCQGLYQKRLRYTQAAVIALFFGLFQAFMPVLGWLLGTQFAHYITEYDHWIAFALLAFLGAKMLFDALRRQDDARSAPEREKLRIGELFLLAIATSIDALAVGVTFAFLSVRVVPAVCLIGCITFALSVLGVKLGTVFGMKYKSRAELAGGIILILLGVKILLEHLGVL